MSGFSCSSGRHPRSFNELLSRPHRDDPALRPLLVSQRTALVAASISEIGLLRRFARVFY